MKSLEDSTREYIVELFSLLAEGESLGMPISRPMPSVFHGAHELRIKDSSGQYRVFYFTKHKESVLVFHMFKKKTEATPDHEISLGQKRLKEMII